MTVLTKDHLLGLKPKTEAVPVPELGKGAEILIREMDALSVLEFGSAFRSMAAQDNVAAQPDHLRTINRLFERCLVKEDGTPLFEPGEFEKVHLSFQVRQRLLDKALELSSMKPEASAEKNSGMTRHSSSRAA